MLNINNKTLRDGLFELIIYFVERYRGIRAYWLKLCTNWFKLQDMMLILPFPDCVTCTMGILFAWLDAVKISESISVKPDKQVHHIVSVQWRMLLLSRFLFLTPPFIWYLKTQVSWSKQDQDISNSCYSVTKWNVWVSWRFSACLTFIS